MRERSRALEYCPGTGKPLGFTKCECTAPSCRARRFMTSANASTLPALSRARHRATSLGLFTSNARRRSIRWYVSPALIFNFTGSAIVSVGCTVTARSRKPLSATMSAVSNFCVLAAGRIWSAFFSYKILPLFASTTMTDAALTFGIPSGVNSVGAEIASSVSFAFARFRCDAAWVDFDAFVLRAGVDSTSASSVSLAVTAFALRTGPATPLGRTACDSAASWLHAFSANIETNAQRKKIRLRHIMAGELAIKVLPAQAWRCKCPQQEGLRFASALDQFDLVTLRRVDKSNFAYPTRMRSIG